MTSTRPVISWHYYGCLKPILGELAWGFRNSEIWQLYITCHLGHQTIFQTPLNPSSQKVSPVTLVISHYFVQCCRKKKQMIEELGEGNINELQLFHGTKRSVMESICKNNFDWRHCGTNGTAYGQGKYN